ncbi:MAG TPA: hypothetical protein VLA68_02000 [Nitrososphaera sp.]|nr:hypothetical protein [Nitrososphaera sp.]
MTFKNHQKTSISHYFKFLHDRRSTYIRFNKQLLIGELAGFGAGIAVAEASAWLMMDDVAISLYSSAADYSGSILGFLAIYYNDNKWRYKDEKRGTRVKNVLKAALSLWPSVVAADVAFILARPYFHYATLSLGLEAGVGATIAHFLAFAVFNGVAILSRSIIDYARSTRM